MGAYISYKDANPDSLVLIRVGNYVQTFYDDAIIIKKFFNFRYSNDRSLFHIKFLNDVLIKLDELNIDHIIYWKDDVILNKKYDKNTYNSYVYQIKKRRNQDDLNRQLLLKIEYLIKNNNRNYETIKKFISGL